MTQQTDTRHRQRDSTTTSNRPVTLDLYVRSLAPRGGNTALEAVIAQLNELEIQGAVDEFTIHVWGERVASDAAIARTDAGEVILARIDAFRAWADRADMSLGSFFATEEMGSEITGETYDTVVLPTMTLAEYEGDTLRFVAPCTDGETVYTLTDRLTALTADTAAGDDGAGVAATQGDLR